MFTATAIVTVPRIVETRCGATRKRGLDAIELRISSQYSHVSMRQLAGMVRDNILASGIVPQAIRQVDVYIRGQHIVSLSPQWGRKAVVSLTSHDDSDSDYAASLRDMSEPYAETLQEAIAAIPSPFDSVPSLGSNDPIRDMLRDFRPIATIFGQADIGDRCCEALKRIGM